MIPEIRIRVISNLEEIHARIKLQKDSTVSNNLFAASVSIEDGHTCLHVHSLALFENATDQALDLAMERTGGSGGPFFKSVSVQPNGKLYLPSQIIGNGRQLRFH
jgi:hypothetical protein